MDCLGHCVDREIYNEGGDGWVVRWEKVLKWIFFFYRLEQWFLTAETRRAWIPSYRDLNYFLKLLISKVINEYKNNY